MRKAQKLENALEMMLRLCDQRFVRNVYERCRLFAQKARHLRHVAKKYRIIVVGLRPISIKETIGIGTHDGQRMASEHYIVRRRIELGQKGQHQGIGGGFV